MSGNEGGAGGIGFLDILNIISFMIGLENLSLNKIQVDGLMKEMTDGQDKMLRKIIQQNEEIISMLKEQKNANSNDYGDMRINN